MATQSGLNRYDYSTDSFKTYKFDRNNIYSIKGNRILSLLEDSKNRLWVGTHGGGLNLYDPDLDGFRAFRIQNGLLSNTVNAIVEDDQGTIWISSDKGISNLNPDTQKIVNYTSVNGIQLGEFNIGSALKLSNGTIMFGGLQGVTFFHPLELIKNDEIPHIVFDQLEVLNEVVKPSADVPLDKPMFLADQIAFNYKQNVFTIHYSGISFRDPDSVRYQYQLVGFDNGWRNVGADRKATYTNLDAGDYQFRVRASNNEGEWGEESHIEVRIFPPPWKTWWAYCLYAIHHSWRDNLVCIDTTSNFKQRT